MSRFDAESADGDEFVYGYDRPLQEYFLDCRYDLRGIVGPMSEPRIYGSALNLLDKITELGIAIPMLHIDELLMDLPLSAIPEEVS